MHANQHSPFFKVRKTLLLLRYTLGLPLQIKDNRYTEFRFVTWLECLRFFVYCLILNSWLINLSGICLLVDGTVENYMQLLKDSYRLTSSSVIDQSSTASVNMLALLLLFVYPILFKNNAHEITSICKEMLDLNTNMNSASQQVKPKKKKCGMSMEISERMVIYGQSLNMTGCILWVVWYYDLVMSLPQDHSLYNYLSNPNLGPFCGAIGLFFNIYGPLSCAAEFVICHMINSLTNLFENWKAILNSKTPMDSTNNETQSQGKTVALGGGLAAGER